MINVEDHRKYVYHLLHRANIPLQHKDDTYQDFCVYYYSRDAEHNPEYAVTTWLNLVFKNFLYEKSRKYNANKRTCGGLVSIDADDHPSSSKKHASIIAVHPDMEALVDAERLYNKLPALFKTLLNTNKTTKIIAQEEGVSRQAIESKLKLLMQVATKDYIEDYA
jgi:DNA-directed RNA polymerase specialized sigma24 family protein